jgi:hypothetical protein
MVVARNTPHDRVQPPLPLAQNLIRHLRQHIHHADILRSLDIHIQAVLPPYRHRHITGIAIHDDKLVLFVIPVGYLLQLTQGAILLEFHG